MRLTLICLLTFMLSHHLSAQQKGERLIKGLVIDSKTKSAVPHASIASYSLVSIFTADSLGRFQILTHVDYSLKIFAMGYEPVIFNVTETTGSSTMYLFQLNQFSFLLNEVSVNGWDMESLDKNLNLPYGIHLGQQSDVPIEYRNDFGGKPPVIAAFISPFSFAYYYLSKREKQKRKMLDLISEETDYSNLTNDLLAEISGLKDDDLEKFRIYCNTNIQLDKRDNEQTLRLKILDSLSQYLKQNHE
jgi:hypothetical protein